ncbi:MAG: hypothetical protein K2X87_27400 [Gemmataceae bacterium]|nr:hypothetical protein [Gemmataceae bacterium]
MRRYDRPDGRRRRTAWRLAKLGIVLAAALAVYLGYFTPQKRAVRHRLAEADARSEAAVQDRLKPVHALFARGRKGAAGFARDALSWGGKWAFVKGVVRPGSHREYLGEAFARHVFAPDELRAVIEEACRAYADDLGDVEGRMLVDLRADLADDSLSRITVALSPGLRTNAAFAAESRALADRVAGQTASDLAVTAGREAVAWVAADVAAGAAVQAAKAAAAEMGIQGGVLATGAGSAVATLGVGIVVGIILDYVLDAVFKLAGYDPEAKVAAAVVESLDRLEAALTRDAGWLERKLGMGTKGSLRAELEKLHAAGSDRRRDAANILRNGGGR